MSNTIRQEKEKVVEELNLDIRDPFTNLVAQAMAVREHADRQAALLRATRAENARLLAAMEVLLKAKGRHNTEIAFNKLRVTYDVALSQQAGCLQIKE
jgi:hypothetical protein